MHGRDRVLRCVDLAYTARWQDLHSRPRYTGSVLATFLGVVLSERIEHVEHDLIARTNLRNTLVEGGTDTTWDNCPILGRHNFLREGIRGGSPREIIGRPRFKHEKVTHLSPTQRTCPPMQSSEGDFMI
jgi:hypothetical protein